MRRAPLLSAACALALSSCALSSCALSSCALSGCARLLPAPPVYAPPARVAAAPDTVRAGLADRGGAATLRVGDVLVVLLPADAGDWTEAAPEPGWPASEPVLARLALSSPRSTAGHVALAFTATRAGSQTLALRPDMLGGAPDAPYALTVVVR